MYLELDRHTESTPHHTINADQGSAMSLPSCHQGHPPLPLNTTVPCSVQGGAASMQGILTPGRLGANSMQLPMTSATFAQSREPCGGSLHGTRAGTNSRPPIPPTMQPQHPENGRRCSMPQKIWKQSHQRQHQTIQPGKSMPAILSVSPPPLPSPPTPQNTDRPVSYLSPKMPWYESDYEHTNNPVSHTQPSVYMCCAWELSCVTCSTKFVVAMYQNLCQVCI